MRTMQWLHAMDRGTGHGWVHAALLVGPFWAALAHPDHISSVTKFRIATFPGLGCSDG